MTDRRLGAGIDGASVALALGGILLLVATFLPWSRRGAGSAIALRRVADLVLSGRVDAFVPRPAGLVVYAVPLGGALLLVAAGLGGRAGATAALAGVLLAGAGTALAALALVRIEGTEVGGGTALATTGAILGILGLGLGARDRRRTARTPSPTPLPPIDQVTAP
ncbi:MAG: hypothetical protein GXY13_03710 [Acidimicrobiales bacterium]|nr:hypothetical protein [Acidimicrobiales bacterium]